ncbi:hypothetical protein I4F81_000398 [Pyropia yezoensis]|uniref:Uncharacterized protein n=1 Tax=Pyropia yezoensis TaxID=2788 RepID=A0ACC3BIP4_PYRYE|nr:hypothetical protein I4F81_000398 [Neopyropia yezoensis]
MGRFRVRRLPPSVAELVITLSNRHVKTQLWDRATHRVVVAAESVEPALRYKIFQQNAPATGAAGAAAAAAATAANTTAPPSPFPGLTPPAPAADPPATTPPPPPPPGSPARTPTPTPTTLSPPAEGGAPPRPFDFGSYATASVAAAGIVGAALASRAAAAGVAGVVWKTHPPPRYHGKVKAVVDALAAEGVTVYSRGEPAGGPVAAHAPPGREGGGAPSEGEEVELGGGMRRGRGSGRRRRHPAHEGHECGVWWPRSSGRVAAGGVGALCRCRCLFFFVFCSSARLSMMPAVP